MSDRQVKQFRHTKIVLQIFEKKAIEQVCEAMVMAAYRDGYHFPIRPRVRVVRDPLGERRSEHHVLVEADAIGYKMGEPSE